MQLNIPAALEFLDILDPKGRHTIASEAPFGNAGGPKWEGGSTFEFNQRKLLIEDIEERQKRGSNVYYSVNRPCPIGDRTGLWGKNNIDDIVAIRALAFDIDFTCPKTDELIIAMLSFFDNFLINELQPYFVISTGGGYQLIYILNEVMNVKLRRPPKDDKEKKVNDILIERRSMITTLAHEFEKYLRDMIPKDLPIKVDNMSNVDRVMRLPGTINYPKSEKLAKGQKPAIAHIERNYCHNTDIRTLRSQVPLIQVKRETVRTKIPFIPRKDPVWPPLRKAQVCCEFIAEKGLADSNEWYTLNVMLPLIGAIHDPDDNNSITEAEAEELFMLAVSGGERYGSIGRGPSYFRRQWKSHRPHLARNGTKSLGGLIFAAEENGFKLPWKGVQMSMLEYMELQRIKAERNEVSEYLVALLSRYV